MNTDTVNGFPASDNLPVEIIGRRVYCRRDMLRWERSQAQADMRAFIERMNVVAAERYRPTAATMADGTENVRKATEVLGQVTQWAELNRPARNDFMVVSTFGKFHAMLRSKSHDLLVRMYGRPAEHRTVELPVYLENSFGDADAMEYGPEHEISFCMFLIALFKLHHLTCADEQHVVTVLFDRYLDVVDFLITSYRLEPSTKFGNSAGLNDYRFLAFLWGSAQLAGDRDGGRQLSPEVAIMEEDAAARYRDRYIFMKCMDTVHRRNHWLTANDSGDNQDDTGGGRSRRPMWWHSYQLWNLTSMSRWDRVNECLMLAYRRDVLGRFEVVRHMVFGELLKFTKNSRPPGISFYDCIPIVAFPVATSGTTASLVTMKTPTISDRSTFVDRDDGRYYDNRDSLYYDDGPDENEGGPELRNYEAEEIE